MKSYLASVLHSNSEHNGWKLPETTLIYPWIVRMFPDMHYIHWVRDPRDSIIGAHRTDNLEKFGVRYARRLSLGRLNKRFRRAASWKYQWELVKSTPPPKKTILVRFEDMILRQDETLKRLEEFLGIPLAKVEVNAAPIGRWKSDTQRHFFDFFEEDIKELGYEL